MVDPVLSELRWVKTQLLEKFDYDMAAMAEDARARQAASGHLVITERESLEMRTQPRAEDV